MEIDPLPGHLDRLAVSGREGKWPTAGSIKQPDASSDECQDDDEWHKPVESGAFLHRVFPLGFEDQSLISDGMSTSVIAPSRWNMLLRFSQTTSAATPMRMKLS